MARTLGMRAELRREPHLAISNAEYAASRSRHAVCSVDDDGMSMQKHRAAVLFPNPPVLGSRFEQGTAATVLLLPPPPFSLLLPPTSYQPPTCLQPHHPWGGATNRDAVATFVGCWGGVQRRNVLKASHSTSLSLGGLRSEKLSPRSKAAGAGGAVEWVGHADSN